MILELVNQPKLHRVNGRFERPGCDAVEIREGSEIVVRVPPATAPFSDSLGWHEGELGRWEGSAALELLPEDWTDECALVLEDGSRGCVIMAAVSMNENGEATVDFVGMGLPPESLRA